MTGHYNGVFMCHSFVYVTKLPDLGNVKTFELVFYIYMFDLSSKNFDILVNNGNEFQLIIRPNFFMNVIYNLYINNYNISLARLKA